MNIVTVATLKGGNAKTTASLAIAAVLAEKGHAVAIVDADPQSTATMILGLKPVAEPWSSEAIELFIKKLAVGSITLVRGGRPLRRASTKQREAFLDRGLLGADFAVVDTAPGEVELVDAALRRSHLVVVPVEPSPLSLTGLCDIAAPCRAARPLAGRAFRPDARSPDPRVDTRARGTCRAAGTRLAVSNDHSGRRASRRLARRRAAGHPLASPLQSLVGLSRTGRGAVSAARPPRSAVR